MNTHKSFVMRNPSVLYFLAMLALFTLGVTLLAEGTGTGLISTSFVKTLGKTLCLCLIAIAMDGLGLLRDPVPWAFRLFRSGWLYDRHVADV